jgi:hypothetical protein
MAINHLGGGDGGSDRATGSWGVLFGRAAVREA